MTSGYLYVLSKSGDDIVLDNSFSLTNPRGDFKQSVILNENTIYFSFCDTDNSGIYNQYIYKVGSSMTQIFKSPNTDIAMPGALNKSSLYTDGLNVFISFNVPMANNTNDYYMGII